MKKIILLACSAISVACSAISESVTHNLTCPGNVVVQYDNKKNDSFKKNTDKKISIFFLNEFNDSIQGYINDKLYFDKIVVNSNNGDEISGYFSYEYSKDQNLPTVKIISKTRNSCCDFKIDDKYRLVYVFFYQDKWIIRYSNSDYYY